MSRLVKIIALPIIIVGVTACGPKDPSQPKPPTPQAGGVIPQAQLDALNKAKNVERVLQDSAQQQREQIDKSEQPEHAE
jgi:hypothetical protein